MQLKFLSFKFIIQGDYHDNQIYYIIIIDITQIIDRALNPNLSSPFLSKYIEVDRMDQIGLKTEVDRIGPK